MPFRFRRSFRRCRSKKGRSDSMPTNQADHGITTSKDRAQPASASCVQPSLTKHPSMDLHLNGHHSDDGTGSDALQYATTIDVYEDRIDELGQLMEEQGRCLDELTERSRRLSSENTMLRERLSSSSASSVVVKQSSSSLSPRGSFSLPTRSPLKHIIRNSQRSSTTDESTSKRVIQKLNDDNAILIQQSQLLTNELTEANRQVAERDESLASLGNKLSSCLETSRSLMMEKKTWKVELSQKLKEIEALQASAKRSDRLRTDVTLNAEQYLAERNDLVTEATDLGTQVSYMTSTIDKQAHELVAMQTELERAIDKASHSEIHTKLVKAESKNTAEAAQAYQHQLQRSVLQNKQLEQKLIEARDKLAESEISHHKLRKMNESLRAEVKDMTEKHVSQTSNWEKGQSKVIAALKEKHSDEIQSHQKRIDILSREHFSLEFENTQCQRDLQSYQHRCTTLEKLIDRSGSESRDSIDKLLLKVNDVEAKLEASKSTDKESKSKVSILEDQLASLHVASNDKVNALKDTIKGLRSQLDDMNEKNQTQLTRIKCLEEEVDAMQHDCTIEKQKMQQVVDQTVSEVIIICEALKVANKNEKIKAQHAEDLLRKTTSLHESLLDQITTEKKELSTKLEKVILDEREVAKSLMNKVQELNSRVQHLTSEKYQLNHQANQHMDQIYNLEKVIANGELKVSQFAKQLTRSMQEQELQLRKEMELKKELNIARIEVEKMRKCHGHGARREIAVTSTTSDGSVDRR